VAALLAAPPAQRAARRPNLALGSSLRPHRLTIPPSALCDRARPPLELVSSEERTVLLVLNLPGRLVTFGGGPTNSSCLSSFSTSCCSPSSSFRCFPSCRATLARKPLVAPRGAHSQTSSPRHSAYHSPGRMICCASPAHILPSPGPGYRVRGDMQARTTCRAPPGFRPGARNCHRIAFSAFLPRTLDFPAIRGRCRAPALLYFHWTKFSGRPAGWRHSRKPQYGRSGMMSFSWVCRARPPRKATT